MRIMGASNALTSFGIRGRRSKVQGPPPTFVATTIKEWEIESDIVKKFVRLNEIAHIETVDDTRIPFWQLKMGNWLLSQSSWSINNREQNIDARATNETTFLITQKPETMSVEGALEAINDALTLVLANFDNDKVVEKGQEPIRVYSEAAIKRLQAAAEANRAKHAEERATAAASKPEPIGFWRKCATKLQSMFS